MTWAYREPIAGHWLACDEATMHDAVAVGLTVGLMSWSFILHDQWIKA